MRLILDKFREPFPHNESSRERFIATIFVSFFIAGFLFLFRPFGAQGLGLDYLLICLGFGLVTFLCMTTFDFLVPRLLRLEMDLPTWTLWKWAVYTLLMICWIAVGNIIFIELLNSGRQLYWHTWLFSIVPQTLAIGVFPTIFYGLVIQMRADKKNKSQAKEMAISVLPQSKQLLNIEVSQDSFITIEEDKLLYARAMQNYVELMHWNGEKVEKTLLRSTLKDLFEQLSSQSDAIKRCHRSFLVNIKAVSVVEGNAQGLKLSLDNVSDFSVPVSRRFIHDVRQHLKA